MASIRTALKTIGFTLIVPGTLAVLIPQVLGRWRQYPSLPVNARLSRIAGTLSLVVGVLLYIQTAFQFVRDGEGTPSPRDEPDRLVTGGVYAYSRNPMYVGVLLVILGQALRQRSMAIVWWGVGMWIGFHNRVIEYEEPHLREIYGEEYEQYCAETPRWGLRR